MIFKNRITAAQELLNRLKKYKEEDLVVTGIPRGAMPMAKIIADGLSAELSAILVHKIPAPYNVELAIGCVGLSGHVHMLDHGNELASPYIKKQTEDKLKLLKNRQRKYGLHAPNFKGKTVIIVDDGIATGATTTCAVHEVRSYQPKKIILATPVSSDDAAEQLSPLVDEFVCLYVAHNMYAIGQFYQEFGQVTDEEVIEVLHRGSLYEHHP